MTKNTKQKNTKTPKAKKDISSTLDVSVYDQKGKVVKSIKLPELIFGLTWNADLVHQVVVGMQSNSRANTADTKDRSEVSGGGKKPWQQKGTGRSRHGSSRSPIWIGGGIAHGPTNERNYKKKLNKKMKAKALFTVLSKKLNNNEIIFVDSLSFSQTKTKEALGVLQAISKTMGVERISTNRKPYSLIEIPEKNEVIQKSFRNIPCVSVEESRLMNPVEILNHKYLILVNPEAIITQLASKVGEVE